MFDEDRFKDIDTQNKINIEFLKRIERLESILKLDLSSEVLSFSMDDPLPIKYMETN